MASWKSAFRDEDIESREIWFKAQRDSISDSVIRESVDSLIKYMAIYAHRWGSHYSSVIFKDNIQMCAGWIIDRDKLEERDFEFANGRKIPYPSSLARDIVRDELRRRNITESGNGCFYVIYSKEYIDKFQDTLRNLGIKK